MVPERAADPKAFWRCDRNVCPPPEHGAMALAMMAAENDNKAVSKAFARACFGGDAKAVADCVARTEKFIEQHAYPRGLLYRT